MMVEVLCGILSGANFGPNVRTWKDFEKVANLVSKHNVKQPLKIIMTWQCQSILRSTTTVHLYMYSICMLTTFNTYNEILQGQCFIAIDPNAFSDGFSDRMSELMDYCRKLEPVSATDTFHKIF